MLNEVVDELSPGLNTWDELPWPGVWIGATIVDQAEADRDIEKLLMTPARRRFLSMEPLLGPGDLRAWFDPTGVCCMQEMQSCEDCPADAPWIHGPTTEYAEDGTGYSSPEIDWVIVGGKAATARGRCIRTGRAVFATNARATACRFYSGNVANGSTMISQALTCSAQPIPPFTKGPTASIPFALASAPLAATSTAARTTNCLEWFDERHDDIKGSDERSGRLCLRQCKKQASSVHRWRWRSSKT